MNLKSAFIKRLFVLLPRILSKMQEETTLLGIDPGTNLLGYGIVGVSGNKVSLKAMGVIDLRKCEDLYTKLGRIFERVNGLITSFHPTEMAIEAPFYGKNVQSMLKLGRAQGVAIAAAVNNEISVHEYAPTKIKMALTGNGSASKEQVARMLQQIFKINEDALIPYLDATDALAVAYCHFMQRKNTLTKHPYSNWSDFARKNVSRIHGSTNNPTKTQPDGK